MQSTNLVIEYLLYYILKEICNFKKYYNIVGVSLCIGLQFGMEKFRWQYC